MSLYLDRIAKGLCGSCGAEDPGGKQCGECKEKSRVRAEAKREKNREGGCFGCGNPTDGGTRCEACKEKAKISRQKSTAKRKANGICVACSEPAKPGTTLCQRHIDERSAVSSARYKKHKELGICRFCDSDTETPNESMCAYHKEKYKDYRVQTKLAVLDAYGGPVCVGCGNEEFDILEIDHIDGGGCQQRRELGITGGYQFYLWLKQQNYPEGYRVLCPTCNKKAHRGLLEVK